MRGKISGNIINNITDTRRITPVILIDTEGFFQVLVYNIESVPNVSVPIHQLL
jgi:hypothetical protein